MSAVASAKAEAWRVKDFQSFACGKRAEELEFMKYDEVQWTPWFVHHFAPTVEHLAPQILEIFRNHMPGVWRTREGAPQVWRHVVAPGGQEGPVRVGRS